ncbi:Protein of unknown function DUF1754, eukaryotic [Nannochloropsis gaditana]|uniref:DUF1754-domain-containing protein n=1 Tax=Nannochloropsis gaditana TaxID=72520 RepID=W7TTM0_9STRA|nr:Protein of unknown function DUF1754, eukaryotic [Nannochloropsis gaditana]
MPVGGALKLKGLPTKDKKKKKRQRDERSHHEGDAVLTHEKQEERGGNESISDTSSFPSEKDDGLTETQRRHIAKLKERERQNIKKLVSKSHRERIDEFNQYLSVLTEHNDIPRVSAAGNG